MSVPKLPPRRLLADLRSDTVTRPTAGMLDAMATAPLGDDVFGDDPTVAALQRRMADVLGKEAALFVPSGTMANQLALRACTQPGDEVIAHARCHIHNYESGGPAALSGVTIRSIDSADGSLPVDSVRAALRIIDDPHLAPTRLIAFENTHNACGGVPHHPDSQREWVALAREHDLHLHLDGARLFNAAVALGTPARALAGAFDTVSVCFSKGLGAPVGSVLVGPAPQIARAHRFRKMFGGGMRQAGVLCAAALYAMDHHIERLAEDHRRARQFAEAIAELPAVRVDLDLVRTNIVYFDVDPNHPASRFAPDVGAPELVARAHERGVGITGGGSRFRAVFHLDADDDALDLAVNALRQLL